MGMMSGCLHPAPPPRPPARGVASYLLYHELDFGFFLPHHQVHPQGPRIQLIQNLPAKRRGAFRKRTQLSTSHSAPSSRAPPPPSRPPGTASSSARLLCRYRNQAHLPISLGLILELIPPPRASSPACSEDQRAPRSRHGDCSLSLGPCDPHFQHPPPNWASKHKAIGAVVVTAVPAPGTALSTLPVVTTISISTFTREETEAQGARVLPEATALIAGGWGGVAWVRLELQGLTPEPVH